MLDNGVASTGTMYVTVPAGVTVTGCAFWALGDTLDPPATMDSWGYWSSGECSLSSALSANTAYGMQLAASAAAAGSFAPWGLATALTDDMATATTMGPVIDTNNVFDSSFLMANPDKTMSLDVQVVVTDPVTSSTLPTDTYLVDWTFTFAFDEGEMLAAPFDIGLSMTDNSASDRAQLLLDGNPYLNWERYPVEYESHTFGDTCTNT